MKKTFYMKSVCFAICFFAVITISAQVPVSPPAQGTLQYNVVIDPATNLPTANYSLTIPGGVQIQLEAWGGGGGGGYATNRASAQAHAGGGGGGGYVSQTINQSVATQVVLQVAFGGAGGSAHNGAAGGNSTFNCGTDTYIAYGGNGAVGVSAATGNGAAGGGYYPSSAVGMSGTNGDNATGSIGGKGGDAGKNASGIGGIGGYGGRSYVNDQGRTDASPLPGGSPGGGGGGAVSDGGGVTSTTINGGDGGSGMVLITLSASDPKITSTSNYICKNGSTTLSVSDPIADGGVTYTWYKDGSAVGDGPQYEATDPGRYTVTAVYKITFTGGKPYNSSLNPNGEIKSNASNEIALEAAPDMELNPISTTVCSGSNVIIIPEAADFQANQVPDGITYEWTLVSNSGATITGAPATQSGSSISLGTFTNTTSYQQTVVYSLIPSTGGCTGDAVTLTIKVNPVASVYLYTDFNAYCENSGGATLTASVLPDGNYTYEWYLDNQLLPAEHGKTLLSKEPYRATAYQYFVVATSDLGCQSSKSDDLYIKVNKLPVVTITTDYTDIGLTGSITATANVDPAGDYNYAWSLDGNPSGYKAQYVLSNLPAGDHDLQVTVSPVQDDNGCDATSDKVTVTVHDKPGVAIAATATTICVGDTARLHLSNFYNLDVDGEQSYQWTVNGNEIPNAVVDSYAQSLHEAGDYVFALRVEINYGQSYTSYWSNQVTVTVKDLPQAMLTGDNDTCCEDSSVLLTATVTPYGKYIYDWYLDNQLIYSLSNINTLVCQGLSPRATPYTYQVVARSAPGGCEGVSNTFTVTVKPAPTVTITTTHTDICPGGSITATAHVLPAGNYNYIWYVDSVAAGYDKDLILSDLPAGKYKLYAEVSPAGGDNGCSAVSKMDSIIVHANPEVTIAADNAAICAGGTAVIKITGIQMDTEVKDESDFSYQWALNGTVIPNAALSSYSQTLTTPGRYEYTVRLIQNNDFGCASGWSKPAVVTVAALPQVSLTVDNGTYCSGSSASLMAAVIPAGKYTYDWYCDNHLILANGDSVYISNEPARASAYDYHVVARSALGCEGVSNTVSVTVRPAPTVTVAVTTDHTDICPGGSVTASVSALPADNYTYAWYLDHTVIGLEQELTVSNLPPGKHTIYVGVSSASDFNGCVTVSEPVTITVHENPVVTVSANHPVLCGSGTVTLGTSVALDSVARDDSRFTYQWAVNGSVVDDATQNTLVQTLLEAGEYSFTARVVQNNILGCASDWSQPVTVTVMSVEVPELFTSSCDDGNTGAYRIVRVPVIDHSDKPFPYSVNFTDATQRALNYSGNIQNNSIEVHLPLQAGDYPMEITINGCIYPSTGRVMVDSYALGGAKLIEQRWNDVLAVNDNPETNGGFSFYAFQWYKDNVLIPGANKQTYTEPAGVLNGEYYVELHGYAILANGNTVDVSFVSCPFKPSPGFSLSVYPVPVKQGQPITFATSLSSEELEDARLEIYDVTGVLRRTVTNLSPQMAIPGLKDSGVYFGRLITATHGVHNIRLIVTQ